MSLREMTGRGARISAAIALAVAAMAMGDGGRRAAPVVTGDLGTVSGGQRPSISIGDLGIVGNFGTAGVQLSPTRKLLAKGGTAQSINIMATDLTTPAISVSGDGVDNDGDGKTDEDPVTGIDEDGDGTKDEDPIDGLDNDAREGGITSLLPMSCFDQVDNNSDGLIDDQFDDDDDGLVNEDPLDGIDNDDDGLVDEDGLPDPGCLEGDALADEDPPPGQIGSDDDKDGREGGPSSAAGTCDDQLDNDSAGGRDLADADCAGRIDEDPVRGINPDGDANRDEDPPDDDLVGEGGTKYIIGNTVAAANQTVITTAAPHGLVAGNEITIIGSDSTPSINGARIVAASGLTATAFKLTSSPAVTVAGATGTIFYQTPMNCVDGINNDGDAYTDRNDPDCQGDGRVDEDPIGGGDTDGDGRIDEDGNLTDCLSNGFTAVTCPFNQDHDGTTPAPKVDEDGPNDDMDGTGRESGSGAEQLQRRHRQRRRP